MRTLSLAGAIFLAAISGCDGDEAPPATDYDLCVEAFDCGMSCHYPADELAELGPYPAGDWDAEIEWNKAHHKILDPWNTCVLECGDGFASPDTGPEIECLEAPVCPRWEGATDAWDCRRHDRDCDAPSCEAWAEG